MSLFRQSPVFRELISELFAERKRNRGMKDE